MRISVLLLLFAAPGFASEEAILHALQVANEDPFSPRGAARMDRAIAGLAADGGVLSAVALGNFLRAADEAEAKAVEERIEAGRRGRAAYSGIEQVKREIEHLRHRENAGAAGLGPQIAERTDKVLAMERTVAAAKTESVRYSKMQEEIRMKREAAVVACARILARLKPEELETAVGAIRKAMDVDKDDQVLLLVRVLRESGRKESAGVLIEVYSHPKTGAHGRTSAACAIAFLAEPNATRQLIERLRLDPSPAEKRILHQLGLSAHQPLPDLDAAAKWAATLQ